MTLGQQDERANEHGVAVKVDGWDSYDGYADGAVTPGAIVVPGSADFDVAEAGDGATDFIGWASDNIAADDDPADGTLKDLRRDYADGDAVVAYRNQGDKFMGILAESESITKEDSLVCAAGGELRAFDDAGGDTPDMIVGDYIGEADQSTGAGETARILVEFGGA